MANSEEYQNELKALDEMIAEEPKDADIHNLKGNLLVKMGLDTDAIKEYEIAIELNPKVAGVLPDRILY